MRGGFWTRKRIENLQLLVAAGNSSLEVARKLGVGNDEVAAATVRNAARRYGLSFRNERAGYSDMSLSVTNAHFAILMSHPLNASGRPRPFLEAIVKGVIENDLIALALGENVQ